MNGRTLQTIIQPGVWQIVRKQAGNIIIKWLGAFSVGSRLCGQIEAVVYFRIITGKVEGAEKGRAVKKG